MANSGFNVTREQGAKAGAVMERIASVADPARSERLICRIRVSEHNNFGSRDYGIAVPAGVCGETEEALCRHWHDHHNILAAHELVVSYRSLVVTAAQAYYGFGLPSEELIGEGYVGLMHAVCRFDPDHDVGFGPYAIRWVRAAIHKCILRKSSMAMAETAVSQSEESYGHDQDTFLAEC